MGYNDLYQEGTLGQILNDVEKDSKTIDKAIKNFKKTGENPVDASTIDAAGNIAGSVTNAINSQRINASSIVARARNSIMQFPIYTSPTIRVNEIHIISKLFERVYADLVRSVISQHPIIDEDEANNLAFLKKFHTNIQESAENIVNKYYQPIDMVDAILTESVFHREVLSDTCIVEFAKSSSNDEIDHLIMSESKRLGSDALEGFGYYFKEDPDNTVTKKISNNPKINTVDNSVILGMIRKDPTMILQRSEIKQRIKREKWDNEQLEDEGRRILNNQTDDEILNILRTNIELGEAPDNIFIDKDKNFQIKMGMASSEVTTGIKDASDTPIFLKDSDIKKTNGMAPFNMEVTFRVRNKNGIETKEVKYILGIKTILHVIRTKDLADELRDLIMGTEKNLQKVRYKTGEINFLDYMFNLKGLKADALKRVNSNKRWIGTLKRLSDYNKLNGTMFKKGSDIVSEFTNGSTPIPNGTLILTQADVLYLTSTTGIDLSVVSNAKKLASNLFLIAIAIIDSTAGTMKVLFTDSDNSWDVQSLAAIDAEIAKTDNSNLMKELNKMVNK